MPPTAKGKKNQLKTEEVCIVMAPLLESVVEPEIKLMDPTSPKEPETPPIDTAPPAAVPPTATEG